MSKPTQLVTTLLEVTALASFLVVAGCANKKADDKEARGSQAPGASGAADGGGTPGVTATEIKIGQTMPYSGPASAYGAIGKGEVAVLQDDQREGRHQRPQDQR